MAGHLTFSTEYAGAVASQTVIAADANYAYEVVVIDLTNTGAAAPAALRRFGGFLPARRGAFAPARP